MGSVSAGGVTALGQIGPASAVSVCYDSPGVASGERVMANGGNGILLAVPDMVAESRSAVIVDDVSSGGRCDLPGTPVHSLGYPITDGGGVVSSADWSIPREQKDFFAPLRKSFFDLASRWRLIPRLRARMEQSSEESLFSATEVLELRECVQNFLRKEGLECNLDIPQYQPFLLDMWRALGSLTGDIDRDLPRILEEGVGTGIKSPIAPSGVWDERMESSCFDEYDLRVFETPWQSASEDVAFTRSLIMKDVEAGFAYILPGGESEARSRWGPHVAAGKLGVVRVPGKNPRLIGDGSVSGANGASCIPEKMRMPDLESIQRFISEAVTSEDWWMFSFDVQGAHKLVCVREDEQGFSIFILDGVWYVYRTCYFGCRWAAYWFSRVGSWLVRLLHRFIWIQHGLFLYVDDGLEFLPCSVGPLLATSTLMLLTAVGVPLSWKKVKMEQELVWIGWRFNTMAGAAFLPYEKAARIVNYLRKLCVSGARVERRELEKAIGLLVWFCEGAFWLRPWLSCLYKLLYKPSVVTRKLLACQFHDVVSSLSAELTTGRHFRKFDVGSGWKLHSVNNTEVSSLSCRALQTPRVKHGCVSAVRRSSPFLRCCSELGLHSTLYSVCQCWDRSCRRFCRSTRCWHWWLVGTGG